MQQVLFHENPHREGFESMKFQGVLKKYNVEIPGFNWKRIGISRGDQEKFMLSFCGSWCLVLEFQQSVTQFYRMSKGKALFCPEFPIEKWRGSKYQVFFQKRMSPTHPDNHYFCYIIEWCSPPSYSMVFSPQEVGEIIVLP